MVGGLLLKREIEASVSEKATCQQGSVEVRKSAMKLTGEEHSREREGTVNAQTGGI